MKAHHWNLREGIPLELFFLKKKNEKKDMIGIKWIMRFCLEDTTQIFYREKASCISAS